MALAALVCLLAQPRKPVHSHKPGLPGKANVGLLLAVWAGYGGIDILFKQLAQSGTAFTAGLFLAFVLAGILMFAGLLAARSPWHKRNLIAAPSWAC